MAAPVVHMREGGVAVAERPEDEDAIDPLLPEDQETPLAECQSFVVAQEEAIAATEAGKGAELFEAEVLQDPELQKDVIEITGRGVRLAMPCNSPLPWLAVHLRDIKRFCSIEVHVRGEKGRRCRLVASSRASLAKIVDNEATIPLMLKTKDGWNFCSFDLASLAEKAFGIRYAQCDCVIVHSSCRVAAVYLQSRLFEERQLPEFLQALAGDDDD